MVRRSKKKTTRRSKSNGFSLIGAAETFMLLNVATQTAFNNDLASFVMGKDAGGAASNTINLMEVLGQGTHGGSGVYAPTAAAQGVNATVLGIMGYNLKKNWLNGAMQMVLIPIGFRLGKALARPAISRTNRLLSKGGIAKTVKL
jgi:hypothetical protein